jgi:chloride channel protein, CIC family
VRITVRSAWRAWAIRASRRLGQASYLQKWLTLGSLIGATAGVGAIVFYEALMACTHFFPGVLAGYHVPTPASEGGHGASRSFRVRGLCHCSWASERLLGGLIVSRPREPPEPMVKGELDLSPPTPEQH